jgi:8-hydroxy-5-deazaflavin:NADPH oxidoreductase
MIAIEHSDHYENRGKIAAASAFVWLESTEQQQKRESRDIMKITTIGKGTIGGTLARLWMTAGHEVTQLGRAGGDAADADVVLLAVPNEAVPAALAGVTGLRDKIIIDATNRLDGEAPPTGYASIAEFVKATTGGPVAKAFNLNYGKLFEQAAAASTRPGNIWVGDEGARAVVDRLSRDIGMQALNGGPLERAATQEAFGYLLNSIVQDAGEGLLFYRFAPPRDL